MSLAFTVVGFVNTHTVPVKVSRLEVIRGAFKTVKLLSLTRNMVHFNKWTLERSAYLTGRTTTVDLSR